MRNTFGRIPQLVIITLLLAMPFIEIGIFADSKEDPSQTETKTVTEQSDKKSDESMNHKVEKTSDETSEKNKIKTGTVQLTNVTDQGDRIAGSEFTLYKKATDTDEDITIYEATNGKSYNVVEIKTKLKTDDTGQIKIEELPFGHYLFVETKTVDGYETTEEPIEFEINSEEPTMKIKTKNKLIKVDEETSEEKSTNNKDEKKQSENQSDDQQNKTDEKNNKSDEKENKNKKESTKENKTNKKSTKKADQTAQNKSNKKSKEKATKEDKVKKSQEERFPIVPFVGDLRTDIDIRPLTDEILSGRTANYLLTLKTSGPRHKYEDAILTVTLPDLDKDYLSFDAHKLNNLTIAGVTPTYDDTSYELIYDFGDELKSGQTYEVSIPLETKNGITPNGTELELSANLQATIHDDYLDRTETFNETDIATVTVEASLDIHVTKNLDEGVRTIDGERTEFDRLIRGGLSFWDLKVTIPKKEYGQLYLDPEEIIKVTDTFTDGLNLTNSESSQVREGPKQTGRSVSRKEIWWNFDPISLEEQEAANDILFETYMNIQLLVESGQGYTGKSVDNKLTVNVKAIDGQSVNDDDIQTEIIFDRPNPGGDVKGTYWAPNFRGPSNGEGGLTGSNDNTNPQVYNDGLLRFRGQVKPYYHVAYAGIDANRGNVYRTELDVDDNLDFLYLTTPGEFIYRPSNAVGTDIPLPYQPEFDIQVKIKGESGYRTPLVNAKQLTTYDRANLGLTDEDHVEEVRLTFTKMAAGTNAQTSTNYYFTPKEDYIGTVTNHYNLYINSSEGRQAYDKHDGSKIDGVTLSNIFNYKNFSERRENNGGRNTHKEVASPKSAQVVPATDREIFARTRVELTEENNGIVLPGDNTLMIHIYNSDQSDASIAGPQEGVVLLPKGVTVKDNPNVRYTYKTADELIDGDFEILDHDYEGTGQQLIKVTWKNEGENYRLPINFRQRAYIDVEIAEDAPTDLPFDYYFFSESSHLQPDPSYDNITAEIDTDDLNGNGDAEETRIYTNNRYHILRSYDLISDKKVRTTAENFEDWNMLSEGIPGETVDYKLTLNNTYGEDISRLTLIDVLPSIGDRAITNPTRNRNSTFEPFLTGPIELDSKFDIQYTTTKNPKRQPLVDETKYPDTTTELNGDAGDETEWMTASEVSNWEDIYAFKIQLKEGETLAANDLHEITFTMQLPNVCDVDQEVFDQDIANYDRAAFNSFAVSTEYGQAVEPLRVGVYMNSTGAIELEKVDEDGEPLEGAVFDLYKVGEDEPLEKDLTTDEAGLIQMEGLEFGEYYFKETKAPTGYTIGDNDEFTFTIDRPGTFQTEEGNCETPETITVTNEKVATGAVELFKSGENNEGLADAVFALYKAGEDDPIEEGLTTNDEGIIQVDELEFGDYYFVETTAPKGYVLDETPIEFTIDALGSFDDGKHVDKVVEVSLKNIQELGAVELLKTDESNEGLAGAVFALYKAGEDDPIEEGLTTNDEGIIQVDALEFGDYYFVETTAPNGYVLDETPIEFTIDALGSFEDGNPVDTVVEVTMTNVKKQGSLTIEKIDAETGESLPGATFELRDTAGDVVTKGTTDSDGKLVFTGLDLGQYTLHETKAPEGYRLLTASLDVDITLEELDITKVIENSEGGFELPDVGGIGTMIFYGLGALLMIVALTFIMKRKNRTVN